MKNGFLPISKEDMREAGIDQLDFVYVCGDAYVDHPSFGHAIISRLLEAHGYKVGIIAQPDWHDKESINILGEPRLGFLVSAGNMDSMVNHYSVSKKRRQNDAFTPGGVMGKRPDYATIVYCNLIRQTYKHKPIIIGGIEASLRRLAHYDYWSNKLKRSILLDSGGYDFARFDTVRTSFPLTTFGSNTILISVLSSTGFSIRSILSNIFSRLSARLMDFSRLNDFNFVITSS